MPRVLPVLSGDGGRKNALDALSLLIQPYTRSDSILCHPLLFHFLNIRSLNVLDVDVAPIGVAPARIQIPHVARLHDEKRAFQGPGGVSK